MIQHIDVRLSADKKQIFYLTLILAVFGRRSQVVALLESKIAQLLSSDGIFNRVRDGVLTSSGLLEKYDFFKDGVRRFRPSYRTHQAMHYTSPCSFC
jgi:hypothetical protein